MKTLKIRFISLFPEMFTSLDAGITGRAIKNELIQYNCINPRSFADNNSGRIDDKPYGGGPGMVMQYAPLKKAIDNARSELKQPAKTLLLSPKGQLLTQDKLIELAAEPALILVCGRYEGIDQRLIDNEIDQEISLGDYVISGGELAAMVVVDGIIRMLPGALGDEQSAQQDSFMTGLLDHPHYTRPEVVNDLKVPDVLTSGNHKAIAKWRMQQSLRLTSNRRPELLRHQELTNEQKTLLNSRFCNQKDD